MQANKEAERRRASDEKLAAALEATLAVKLEAANELRAREKVLGDECAAKLDGVRVAAAGACASECDGKVKGAVAAADAAARTECEGKVQAARSETAAEVHAKVAQCEADAKGRADAALSAAQAECERQLERLGEKVAAEAEDKASKCEADKKGAVEAAASAAQAECDARAQQLEADTATKAVAGVQQECESRIEECTARQVDGLLVWVCLRLLSVCFRHARVSPEFLLASVTITRTRACIAHAGAALHACLGDDDAAYRSA